jgi:hypothetical protein
MKKLSATDVFLGSDGEVTKNYYLQLKEKGPLGELAVAVFRAQKCSSRAKAYTRHSWTQDAYQRKVWSIGEIIKVLLSEPAIMEANKINWGWKKDPNVIFDDAPSWVFYCDLPTGQVSFHCKERGDGKDYDKEWDGVRNAGTIRIMKFCNSLFEEPIPVR